MGPRVGTVSVVIGLLVTGAVPASPAFTPKSRAEITRNAVLLMPDALQRQLSRHAERLYRSALERPAGELPPGAQPLDVDAAAGELEESLVRAVHAVEQQRPMGEVVAHLGRAARVVQDLCLTTHLGPFDRRHPEFHRDYARFVESRLPRIRVVFDGFEDAALAAGDIDAFARRLVRETRRDYPAVVRSYFPDGRERLPQDFDDRSVAFGVASLEVSRAVTATARAWLFAWHRAHGDLTGAARLAQGRFPDPFAAPSHSSGAGSSAPSEERSP
jgi:hypothetical protein